MSQIIKNTAKALWKAASNPRKALRKAGILPDHQASAHEAIIPIKTILRSGEANIPSSKYSRLISEPLRASQRAIEGPHVEFLLQYLAEGDTIFEDNRFQKTRYYQNAAQCISFIGYYFPYIRKREDIILAAQNFIAAFKGQRPERHRPEWGHNGPNDLIVVRPINDSECFELVDGNHRLASCFVKGKTSIRVKVLPENVTTPAQEMLKNVLWQNNRLELYQPVELPEVQRWRLVRKCIDRYTMMINFLNENNIKSSSYLDVGSSYGWFVKSFLEGGFLATGVERDSFAINIGVSVYGVSRQKFIRSDICDFLQSCPHTYEVTSCFSVAHHFAMGNGPVSAEWLIRQLDRITGKILFFDTGQSHEEWFKQALPSWDDDFVERLLRENSNFHSIYRLGRDADGNDAFSGNFGRTLFACRKN